MGLTAEIEKLKLSETGWSKGKTKKINSEVETARLESRFARRNAKIVAWVHRAGEEPRSEYPNNFKKYLKSIRKRLAKLKKMSKSTYKDLNLFFRVLYKNQIRQYDDKLDGVLDSVKKLTSLFKRKKYDEALKSI